MFSSARLSAGIAEVLNAFGRSPDEPQADSTLGARLCLWAERVVAWNQRIDLTAARSAEELVDLLVADAAALAPSFVAAASSSCVDVGSGAGAPGIGLALLVPALKLTLVEPKTKRVAFLRSVVGALGRPDVRVERTRSEQLPAQGWDFAVSRATLEPSAWRDEGMRLARRGVWVLLAQHEPPDPGHYEIVADFEYRWPLTGVRRRAVSYAKRREFSAT